MAKRKEEPTCTVEELLGIISHPSGGMFMLPSTDLDEVYSGVYIGDESSARNIHFLKRLEFTHVLNTAKGPKDKYHVNTSHVEYTKVNIKFMAIEATDQMNFKLNQYFDKTAAYINEALAENGKVLVHCREGVSRSSTIVLAFLMLKRHMTAQDAVRHVRHHREICPNDGFLQQLCDLNDQLHKKGHFSKKDDSPETNIAETTNI